MAQLSGSELVARLDALLERMPKEDPLERVLAQNRALPPFLRQTSTAELVRWLRGRCDMTQRQLAALSGLPPSKIAKIEGGQDVRVSTLRQLFAGFGCGLVLLPLTHLGADGLFHRTQAVSSQVKIRTRRRYPRR